MSAPWDRAWRRRAARELRSKHVSKQDAARFAEIEATCRTEIAAKSGLAAAEAVSTYITRLADGTMIFEARLFGTEFYRAVH